MVQEKSQNEDNGAREPAERSNPAVGLQLDGSITSWNAAAESLYGFSEAEAIGQPLQIIYPVNPFARGGTMMAPALAGECVEHMEAFHRNKAGEILKVSISLLPKREGPDGATGLTMVVEHATNRGAGTDEDSQNRLWTWGVVETAVDGIVTINEAGLIEYMNPAAQQLFGYGAEELLGQNVNVLMPSPYRAEHDQYLKNYLDTGHRKIIGIGREVSGLRKNGSTFPIALAVSEVRMGERRIFTGVLHDITEQKKDQAEKDHLLHELNRRNKELDCLYRVGEVARSGAFEKGTFRQVAEHIHGAISNPSVSGTRITIGEKEYKTGPFQSTPWCISADITAGERTRGTIDVFFLEGPETGEATRVVDEQKELLLAVALILGEAIERAEAEAKVIHASKLASIGELAAGVGHEINNPVNGIINCADLLIAHAKGDSKTCEYAELIRSEADRIAVIVHNLLTFSRQDKEAYSLARLSDIVEGVMTLCRKKLVKSHIELSVDVPDSLPRLKCRSEQLQQVIMNLIINALHSLDEEYPNVDSRKKLTIVARCVPENEAQGIRLTVSDSGGGIKPADMERIFDPFFTTKGRDKGTGLGLSISDGIVKDHNGSITVETEPGNGAAFHIDLPLDGTGSPAFRAPNSTSDNAAEKPR
jgi:PAS domain S-box-containing protein